MTETLAGMSPLQNVAQAAKKERVTPAEAERSAVRALVKAPALGVRI